MFWLHRHSRPSVDAAAGQESSAMGAPVAIMLSDVGCCRELNEDYAQIVRMRRNGREQELLLAIVADGMGGHQAGEIASQTAVDTIKREYPMAAGHPGEALKTAFQRAHRAIRKRAQSNPAMEGMGTTCTAVVIAGQQAWAAHVGDSRLYLVRDGEIYQLSEDHTQCMDMVRRGLLTLEEAKRHEDRNVLTHAMGTRKNLVLTTWPEPMRVKPRDVFVLCSDGLHDLVSDVEIGRMIGEATPATACKNLIGIARDRGGYDNITLIVIAVPSKISSPAGLKETGQYEVCV